MSLSSGARENASIVLASSWRHPAPAPVPAVDLANLNSPHTMAVLSIRPGASVLDVGCGRGIVAAALAARGCQVWGLEIDSGHAESARQHCTCLVEADVETIDLAGAFPGVAFDAVLFLDVLEHLRDPAATLAKAARVLAPGGRVLLSIPNVAHGALRLELLSGKFRYRESGLLDRGHLRFFDGAAVDELVRASGFRIESKLRVTRHLDQTEFELDLAAIPESVRTTLENDPDSLTYQFFVIAEPDGGPASLASDGAMLVERQQFRIDELGKALKQGEAYARHLESELGRHQALVEELQQTTGRDASALADLQGERAARDARLGELEDACAALTRATTEAQAYARHLEQEVCRRDEDIAARGLRLGELEDACAALTRATTETQAHVRHLEQEVCRRDEDLAARDVRLSELEELCANLKRVNTDAESYVAHLEREIDRRVRELAVRDDALIELRARVEDAGRTIHALTGDVSARDARLAHAQAEHEAHVHQLRAEHAMTLRHVETAAAGAGEEVARLRALMRQPRHRLAERGNDALKRRLPIVHRLLRPLVASRSIDHGAAVRGAAAPAVGEGQRASAHHGIRPGYVERDSASYFVDAPDGVVYQPDVHVLAGTLAQLGGARYLVDIGCGRAEKLVESAQAFGLTPIGIDYGENLARCRAAYPAGAWIEADLESAVGVVIPADVLRDAVVVCADVIEHLKDPTNLLALLRECMRSARAGLLSTPERDRTRGPDHPGPPPNPCHVREWNARELREFLQASGLTVTFTGLTRSHNVWDAMQTILVMLGPTR